MKFFVGCGIGFISRSGLHFGYEYTYNPQPGQKKANFVNSDKSFTRDKEKIFQDLNLLQHVSYVIDVFVNIISENVIEML